MSGLVSPKASLLGLQTAICVPTWTIPVYGHPLCYFLFLQGHQSYWLRALPLGPHFFFLFRATPAAYGSSPGQGLNRAIAASLHTPQPQQLGIRAASVTYAVAHGNEGSLTH